MARLNKQTIEALRDMAEVCEGELVGTGITLLLEWHDRASEAPRQIAPDITSPWCFDMASAPHNTRILVLSDPGGEVYAAHWVQHPGTGDEAWLISESSDGSQHLCKAKAWASIPAMPEVVNG
ncbi:MAG: hypothetical protein LCH39_01920 [Proteobacteria bacterium]|nr:hypothetical protein [Pseudomonadota bacterium]